MMLSFSRMLVDGYWFVCRLSTVLVERRRNFWRLMSSLFVFFKAIIGNTMFLFIPFPSDENWHCLRWHIWECNVLWFSEQFLSLVNVLMIFSLLWTHSGCSVLSSTTGHGKHRLLTGKKNQLLESVWNPGLIGIQLQANPVCPLCRELCHGHSLLFI